MVSIITMFFGFIIFKMCGFWLNDSYIEQDYLSVFSSCIGIIVGSLMLLIPPALWILKFI